MTSLASTSTFCPSSFQLKLALNGGKSLFPFAGPRFPQPDRRRPVFKSLVVRSSAINSNITKNERHCHDLSKLADNLSGNFDADHSERHSGDSKGKQWLKAILRKEVAGVVLFAGLAFAGLSMRNGSLSEPELILREELSSSSGIPAPTAVSTAVRRASPGKVLVPAVVNQLQARALSTLKVSKVIEDDVQPGDLCSRREYARWLVSASNVLSRNKVPKVCPAMYIENVSELAFDDITPADPDFPSIQGLAEAGIIASKLSRRNSVLFLFKDTRPVLFSPESPLSRQDLVSWKMALEKRQLPVVNRKIMKELSGFVDIDKIERDAWPALVADLEAAEQGIIGQALGYTKLFQPEKPVTKAQAAIALSTYNSPAAKILKKGPNTKNRLPLKRKKDEDIKVTIFNKEVKEMKAGMIIVMLILIIILMSLSLTSGLTSGSTTDD